MFLDSDKKCFVLFFFSFFFGAGFLIFQRTVFICRGFWFVVFWGLTRELLGVFVFGRDRTNESLEVREPEGFWVFVCDSPGLQFWFEVFRG